MRKGFSLLEFLILCVLLLAASTLLVPRALAPRRALNEEQAIGYLAMIGGAERAWREETGAYVSLQRAAHSGPARDPARAVPPLVPAEFLFDRAGIGHRGGFRFRLARGADGRIAGCWAWPNLRGFSGAASYWAAFDAGEVRRALVGYSWKEEPPETAPGAAEVESAVLATF